MFIAQPKNNAGIRLADLTIGRINEMIEADQGASFRGWQGKVFPHMSDAYRDEEDDGFREHLGASLIGTNCARALYYGFHWAVRPQHPARVLRLFNRGHLEEARFIAMLLMIGYKIFQQDSNGNQFRISHANGHFGGSGDGIAFGVLEVPDQYCLLEFKTHGEKSFLELKKKGVKEAKFEHYVQMNVYMRKMGLAVALYLAVNKNTDELYGEILVLDTAVADQFLERGQNIVYLEKSPAGIANSPGAYGCTFCDFKGVCHLGKKVERNCRTCQFSQPSKNNKTWLCKKHDMELDKEKQLKGCGDYQLSRGFEK